MLVKEIQVKQQHLVFHTSRPIIALILISLLLRRTIVVERQNWAVYDDRSPPRGRE